MSLIPFILDLADELHEFSRCLANGIDINDFGFGLYTGSEQQNQSQPPSASTSPQQQQSPRRSRTSSFSSFWMPTKRHHPYNRIKSACCGKSAGEEGGATGTNATTASPEKDATPVPTPNKTASYSVVNKNGFQVSMNVKQFAPNELSVKTIDNCIVVEGRHDDKEDGHGVISRHFVRKYMLPKGYDPKDVMSTLSSDGILTVKAPPPPPPSAKVDEPNERIVEIQPTPGPTQVVPATVSAGAQPKEQTKKPLSPAAREECQLPEKRQKLDVAQQQQPQMDKKQEVVQEEQDTVKQQQAPPTQTIPATKTTQSQSTSTPPQSPASGDAAAAGAGALNDNEKVEEEQTAEIDDKQQQQQHQQKEDDRVDGKGEQQQQTEEEITDVETNNAVAAITTAEEDKTENQLETKESSMEIDETENNKTAEADEEGGEERDMVEKKLPETNGSDNIGEIAEAIEPAAESCTNTNTTTSSAEKSNDEVPAEAVSEADGQPPESNAMEVDGDDDVAEQTNNTAADEDATNVGAGEDKLKEGEKEKKADDKCPETAENSNSTPINNDKEDNKANSKSTGETPADAADSVAAESANDKVSGAETAVDTTTATATTIATDIDVALLKKAAATADAAEITAAAENALLSEPMDGIATTDSPVDTVECSLFAKSLGNGNSNSAAALVAKEEVAN